jgi:hypothetical protein
MTEWILCRWHGTPAALTDALRGLGWCGPGEQPAAPVDPRIGGFLPPPGAPPRELDGVAYGAVVANAPLPIPPGLSETGPELSAALLGSF